MGQALYGALPEYQLITLHNLSYFILFLDS